MSIRILTARRRSNTMPCALECDDAGALHVIVGGAGGGPATIADGADVTQGAIADPAVVTDAPGTISSKLRGLVALLASLIHAEDAIHVSGDDGIMALGVRQDTPGTLVGADGDYHPMLFDEFGNAWVSLGTKLDEGNDSILIYCNTVKDGSGTSYVPVVDADGRLQTNPSAAEPIVTPATGAGAIATSYSPAAAFWLESVTCHFSSAPVSAGDFMVTLDANDGAVYDTLLDSVDPSVVGAADLVYKPDGGPLLCEAGDAIVVAYANPDNRTFGVRIVARLA